MGNSATVEVSFADKLDRGLFVGSKENFADITLGRAAPSAAPSLQKRGPRPLLIGGRGRLPYQLANPCRDFVIPWDPSMEFVITVLIPVSAKAMRRVVERTTLAVGARGARRPIAMVRRLGMAMAIGEGTKDLFEEAMTDAELVIVEGQPPPRPGRSFFRVWADMRRRVTTTLETPRPAALTSTAPLWGGRA